MGNITGTPDFTEGFVNTGLKHLEYYKSAATGSISDGVVTDVIFNTELTDSFASEYNNATGVFTASEAGFYLFSWVVGIDADSVSGSLIRGMTHIEKNSVNYIRGAEWRSNSNQTVETFGLSASFPLKLAASDTAKITATGGTSSGTWQLLGNSVASTYLSITKIG